MPVLWPSLQDLLDSFGYASDYLIEDGHVWTQGLRERFTVQVRLDDD